MPAIVAAHEAHRLELDGEIHARRLQHLLRGVEKDLSAVNRREVEFHDHTANQFLFFFKHLTQLCYIVKVIVL